MLVKTFYVGFAICWVMGYFVKQYLYENVIYVHQRCLKAIKKSNFVLFYLSFLLKGLFCVVLISCLFYIFAGIKKVHIIISSEFASTNYLSVSLNKM